MRKLVCFLFVLLLCAAAGCSHLAENNASGGKPSEREASQMKYEIELDYPTPESGPGIIKVYKQNIPAARFIGKNYGSRLNRRHTR